MPSVTMNRLVRVTGVSFVLFATFYEYKRERRVHLRIEN